MAIDHAQRILDWQENLASEDMPPQWMWPLDHELIAWFDDVRRRHEARHGAPRDEVDMTSNDLAPRR